MATSTGAVQPPATQQAAATQPLTFDDEWVHVKTCLAGAERLLTDLTNGTYGDAGKASVENIYLGMMLHVAEKVCTLGLQKLPAEEGAEQTEGAQQSATVLSTREVEFQPTAWQALYFLHLLLQDPDRSVDQTGFLEDSALSKGENNLYALVYNEVMGTGTPNEGQVKLPENLPHEAFKWAVCNPHAEHDGKTYGVNANILRDVALLEAKKDTSQVGKLVAKAAQLLADQERFKGWFDSSFETVGPEHRFTVAGVPEAAS